MSKNTSYGSTRDSNPLETLGLLEETRRYQVDAENTSGRVLNNLRHQNQQIRNANQHVFSFCFLLFNGFLRRVVGGHQDICRPSQDTDEHHSVEETEGEDYAVYDHRAAVGAERLFDLLHGTSPRQAV